jgi:conjugal transfer pilus assembly protein TrbC
MRILRNLSAAAFLAWCGTAWAQAVSPVTPADIERAKRSQPVITQQDIERAVHEHGQPNAADLAKVPAPHGPNLSALPRPAPSPARQPVDLSAIAKGFDAAPPMPGETSLQAGPALLVFISFSMPDATLSRLVDQASRSGATLMVRGLIGNSIQQTAVRARELIGARSVGFQLDPQAFDRFGVSVVPTFVLLKAGAPAAPCSAGTCYPPTSFVSVSGDVSIDYALGHIQRAAPGFANEAGALLSRFERRRP